jgi:hypothetical protein
MSGGHGRAHRRSHRRMAGAGEVLAARRTVRDLSAGSGLTFESPGLQRLKGLPEDTEIVKALLESTARAVRSSMHGMHASRTALRR